VPWVLVPLFSYLPVFAAVLFRIGGLVMTAPIYGSRTIPLRIRAALAVAVAASITPLLVASAPSQLSLSALLLAALAELGIGALIGISLGIVIMAAEVAGTIAGQQAGLALSHVVDPTLGEEISVLGQIYTVTITLVFLAIGGHRAAMAAVLDSYRLIPLFSFRMEESAILLLVQSLTAAFILGIRLAGPVLIALFLSGTAMAFLSRTMPQLNILSVGFTLRTLLVLGCAGLALDGAQEILVNGIYEAFARVDGLFGTDSLRALSVD
jgi:flagellar biosynthetic protein FliR